VLDHWDRLHRHFLKEVFVDHLPIAQKQHWQILGAIRSGDADRVEKLVRKHNQSALRAYMGQSRQNKDVRMTTSAGRTRRNSAVRSQFDR
jgi:DNA-binding GntR family transcriptional regulator